MFQWTAVSFALTRLTKARTVLSLVLSVPGTLVLREPSADRIVVNWVFSSAWRCASVAELLTAFAVLTS
jgi:hypothetical protein